MPTLSRFPAVRWLYPTQNIHETYSFITANENCGSGSPASGGTGESETRTHNFYRSPSGGLVATLLFQALLFAGCAKTGEPQPPLVRTPKPAVDLAARQYSDRVVLTLSMPTENTDGSALTTLASVQLFRLTGDRTESAAPIGEEEFLKISELVFDVPAEQLSQHLREKTLVFEDPLIFENRSLIYVKGFRYASRFINRKRQTAGLGNQVYVTPVAIPEAPAGISAELAQGYVRLQWTPPQNNTDKSRPARIAGYNVYRTEDPQKLPQTPRNAELLLSAQYEDRSFEFEKTYNYAISVVGSKERPYAESSPSAVLTVRTKDTFPPGMPQDLNAVAEKAVVILLWRASQDPDVAGYRVYRKDGGAGERKLLQADLVTTFSYRDEKVPAGLKYEYHVSAVDRFGNEGVSAAATVEVP